MQVLRAASLLVCLCASSTALAQSTAAFPGVPPAAAAPASEPAETAPVPASPTAPQYAYQTSQSPRQLPPQWSAPYYPHSAPPNPCADGGDAPCDDKPEQSHWYGWQTLAVDGTSLALIFAGAGARADVVAGIGGFGAVLGAPVVHFVHDRVGAGFGSLGLRVALPLAGAAIGASAANCDGHHEMFCGIGEAGVGFIVGAAAAIVIDAAVLARETVVDEGPVPMRTLRLTPIVDPNRRLGAVAVSGAF
jgi:hypothetical protein